MYAQQKAIDNVHIVRERDRQRFRELLAVCSLAIPIGIFLLLFSWQNIEVIRLAREATVLQEMRSELERVNRRLALEMETRTALSDISRRAGDLDLQPADSVVVVRIESGADTR
ncbi:MAG: hypothetical protein KY459_05125 [Acidobacteria bacterium]|nr:hypothetical protein [Acidobacteriota bacterium]